MWATNKQNPSRLVKLFPDPKQDTLTGRRHQVGVVRSIIIISNKHHFITSIISSFHARVVEIIATHRLILRSASTVFDPSVDEYNSSASGNSAASSEVAPAPSVSVNAHGSGLSGTGPAGDTREGQACFE